MDWTNERYVRVYTRDTSDWIALGWEAQALLMLLMRKVDRSGVYEMGKHGLRGLAALLRMPDDVVARALPVLLEDGCVEQHNHALVIPNFVEAQEATMSPQARQRESRERRRDAIRSGIDPWKRSTVVYFIQSENGGPIKIGHAEDLAKRLLQLQTSRPDKLVVLAAAQGTVELEKRLHTICAQLRERGEWFTATAGLMSLIRLVPEVGDLVTILDSRDWSQIVTSHEQVSSHEPRLVTPSVPSVPSEPSQTFQEEHPPRAPARDPRTTDPDVAARKAAGDALWVEHQEARQAVAAELGLENLPLPPQDGGRTELAHRLRQAQEAGEPLSIAVARCRHVIARVAADCTRDRTMRWLDGQLWRQDRFDTSAAQPLDDAGPVRGGRAPAKGGGLSALLADIRLDEAKEAAK